VADVTRWEWLRKGLAVVAWIALMIPTALVTLVMLTPAMLAFSFVLVLRIVLGFPLGLIYPPLGERVMPSPDFGDGWLERVTDVALAPMDWLYERL
jgi:hypothetical protein